MIISHEHEIYRRKRPTTASRWNGAYYYSVEILRNIIPRVKTDRSWITINIPEAGAVDGAIVFIHNNKQPDIYNWLKRYNDLILVCGVPGTVEKVAHIGKAIYLPLSVDLKDVRRHKGNKTRDTAFIGREAKKRGYTFPQGTDIISNMPRERLLDEMARYKQVYAVGRTAIEARVLGCDILPYDERYPDVYLWQPFDNKHAAALLQEKLDGIDGGPHK